MDNNLFRHSPKELATDGFLKWLIYEIRGNNKLVLAFFKSLGLCELSAIQILNVKVLLQEGNHKDGRVDLIVCYEVDGIAHKALFENKIHSTIHSNQLEKYKKLFPDCNYYKYLKLARVNYDEEKSTKLNGYDILTSSDLLAALRLITIDSEILNQYKDFLTCHFIKPIEEIETTMIPANKYKLFSSRQAQHYFIDRLYRQVDGSNNLISFNSRSNVGGTPWTTLGISRRQHAYGSKTEYLYWRVDGKARKYYLRLNQYSGVDSTFKATKRQNLMLLRESIKPFLSGYDELHFSRPSNRGVKESEVCILFFEGNDLRAIDNILPELTRGIVNKYQSLTFK